MPAFIDMTGETFGSLTVLRLADRDGSQKIKWVCSCTCGNEAVVDGTKLRSRHTQSCGCRYIPAIDRFAEKIATTDSGCIVWLGGTNGVGYGLFYVGEGRSARTYAHRWSYEYHVGPIPEDLHVDHLCRNRACVNPAHLEPVTVRENLLRGEGPSAANARKTHCPKGHPLSGDNLYVHPRKIMRRCRECMRNQSRQYRTKVA